MSTVLGKNVLGKNALGEKVQGKKAQRKSPLERAAEIVVAARSLALESGLTAVTLRGVAVRAGVTPALVAHYQPNMELLVAATFSAIVRAELAEVHTAIEKIANPIERLAQLLVTSLDGSRNEVGIIWVESWAIGRRNEALAASVRTEMDAWHSLICSVIDAGVRAGKYETADTAAVAWQILGMIDGLNAQQLVHWGRGTNQSELLARAVEGMLRLPAGSLG